MNHGSSSLLPRSFFLTVLIAEAIQHVFALVWLISHHIAVVGNRIRSDAHYLAFPLFVLQFLRAIAVDLNQETVVHRLRLAICLIDGFAGVRDVNL